MNSYTHFKSIHQLYLCVNQIATSIHPTHPSSTISISPLHIRRSQFAVISHTHQEGDSVIYLQHNSTFTIYNVILHLLYVHLHIYNLRVFF